jgi:hypothetical protein
MIKYTKKGQPYKIDKKTGRAIFLKRNAHKSYNNTRGITKMARRRKSFKTRSYGKATGILGVALPAMAYGAVREKISTAITPYTNKIPLGNISDEVGMGILAILAKRTIGKKAPFVAKIADAALVIESARIGEAVIKGNVMNTTSSNNSDLWNGGNY